MKLEIDPFLEIVVAHFLQEDHFHAVGDLYHMIETKNAEEDLVQYDDLDHVHSPEVTVHSPENHREDPGPSDVPGLLEDPDLYEDHDH